MKKIHAFVFLGFVYSIYQSVQNFWVCDDAFISFRYAKNLAMGHGLVFNKGEYVEGFTNLLWTLMLAPAIKLGLDPVYFAGVVGIFFHSLLLGDFLYLFAKKHPPLPSSHKIQIAIIFLGLCLHHHLHIFASSGLETALFLFLVFHGVTRVALFLKDLIKSGELIYAFFVLALAVLTRPDGLLVFAICAFFVLIYFVKNDDWIESLKKTSRILWPGLLVILVSVIFRYYYYHEWFPNTFFAKSAHKHYFSQGIVYIWLYFSSYWILVPVLLFVLYDWSRNAFNLIKKTPTPNLDHLLINTVILAWIGYIAWIGGDFMFARFLLPITPLLFYRIASTPIFWPIMHRYPHKRALAIVLTIIVGASVYFRIDPYKNTFLPQISGISEENRNYPLSSIQKLSKVAKELQPYFQKSRVSIAFSGGQAFLIYYLDPVLAIESSTGLTDKYIAKISIQKRSLIGHEKPAPLQYLQQRGIHLWLTPPTPHQSYQGRFSIKGLPGEFIVLKRDEHKFKILRPSNLFSGL